MKTVRAIVTAALIAPMLLGAATPALAGDLLFHADDGEAILANFDGRPYWELQAYCAGFHGATANYWDKKGESDKARASEAAGVSALNDAVKQLMRDRGVTAAAAEKTAAPVVTIGGRTTAESLRADGMVSSGRWNYWRSFCIDARAAYRAAAR